MTVFVRYNVPVLVQVDLTGGRVVRVQIEDEAATGPEEVFVIDEPPLRDRDHWRATDITEHEPWPAWEFGG